MMERDQGILVVIPTLNEADNVARVLDELSRDLPDAPIAFWVIDGGSGDGTGAIVEQAARADSRVRLLDNPLRIQSAALNLAARKAPEDVGILLRCDAHSAYPAGFVRQVVEALDKSGADSVVVPMDSVGTGCAGRAIAWVSDTFAGSGGSAHRGGTRSGWVDHGHHAGWRIDSFRRAGGYDESFTHNEDAELDCRIVGAGGRIWLAGDIRLSYFVRSTFAGLWRQYRSYGLGRSRTVRRHPRSLRLRQFAVPIFVVLNVAALLVSPWFPPALVLPALYCAGLAAVSIGVALQRRSLCGLLAGLAAGVMHLAWALGFITGLLTTRERRRPASGQPEARFGSRGVGHSAAGEEGPR